MCPGHIRTENGALNSVKCVEIIWRIVDVKIVYIYIEIRLTWRN